MLTASLPPDPPAQIIQSDNFFMTDQNPNDTLETPFISSIIAQESSGDDFAVGDKKLKNHAYGPLQIRQPCVDDVNRVYGTHYTAQDMLGNRPLSIWVFNKYMEIYATPKRLGRPVTDVDRARIWNGGPDGWENPNTIAYANMVQEKIA